jgi:hypothetical protein
MIAGLVKTLNGIVTGQETISSHVEFLVIDLHDKGCAQVDDISITDIGELGIGKSTGINVPKLVKTGFPKKINEMTQRSRRGHPVIIIFKMISMEEFHMLHGTNL